MNMSNSSAGGSSSCCSFPPPSPQQQQLSQPLPATAATVGVSAGVVDAKLLHLVRKQLLLIMQQRRGKEGEQQKEADATQVVVDDIYNRLRNQHREYHRKNGEQLRKNVKNAVQQIQQQQQSQQQQTQQRSSSSSRTGRRNKRKKNNGEEKNNDDEDDDLEYDIAARAHDAVAAGDGGGGLNASLRNRYRQVAVASQQQQQPKKDNPTKEGEEEGNNNNNASSSSAAEVAVVATSSSTTTTITNAAAADAADAPTTRNGGNNGGSTTTATTSTANNNNNKRKKLKRGSSFRQKQQQQRRGSGGTGGTDTDSLTMPCSERPVERYNDLGGMSDIIQELRQLVEYPLLRPELYRFLGVIDPPRGVLLRGPPGTGKTHLANAVAGQLGVPYFRVSAPELVSGMSGESEQRIRDLFQAASDHAPSIIFLDEIDAIAPKRNNDSQRGMEKRMVAQLLTSMDSVTPRNNRNQNAVLVLAATNRPDALDPALRRAGRFDKEILLGVPDEDARERILRTMTSGMRLLSCTNATSGDDDENDNSNDCQQKQHDFDYKLLARKTPGFVGADIKSLTKEAAVIAINRIFRDVLKDHSTHNDDKDMTNNSSSNNEENGSGIRNLDTSSNDIAAITPLSEKQMAPLYVTMEDFLDAIPLVQPSSKREGFATVPDVSWDNVGALQAIREELTLSVLEPIRSPEKFQALGLPLPAGVMLYGPPGCGKTLLAKAIANESGANFISVKGPELLDKYVGESEKAVRLVFERARSSSPCIVFFDELDSLVPRRGSDSGGGGVSERVVNQLLTEMDGLESRRSVFVIAATNRPELIDPAMLRPGRLDKLLYVPLPTPAERASILQALATHVTLGDDVDLAAIGTSPRAEGYSGADLSALLREAGLAVIKEDAAALARDNPNTVDLCVRKKHFDAAYASVMPSVSKRDHARYDKIRDRMAQSRSRVVVTTGSDDAADDAGKTGGDAPITNKAGASS